MNDVCLFPRIILRLSVWSPPCGIITWHGHWLVRSVCLCRCQALTSYLLDYTDGWRVKGEEHSGGLKMVPPFNNWCSHIGDYLLKTYLDFPLISICLFIMILYGVGDRRWDDAMLFFSYIRHMGNDGNFGRPSCLEYGQGQGNHQANGCAIGGYTYIWKLFSRWFICKEVLQERF